MILHLPDDCSAAEIAEVTRFLRAQGAFNFPVGPAGLFPAAAGTGNDFEVSGYRSAWTRDTVHIAHALWAVDDDPRAVAAMQALARFYVTQLPKVQAIADGHASPDEVGRRPAIRFDGDRLAELDEPWPHAQNDALGYFMWFYLSLVEQGEITPGADESRVVMALAKFLLDLPWWRDEDSGHWEEIRKVSASSIGVACQGLAAVRDAMVHGRLVGATPALLGRIEDGLREAKRALGEILPSECVSGDPRKNRRWDASLLFLIEPTGLLRGDGDLGEPLARQIVAQVVEHLAGPIGIKRYLGDSYWSADYRLRVTPEERAIEVSEDPSARDAGFIPGSEAQWCIFDSIISVCYGRWFAAHGNPDDRHEQMHHLRRALAQLTGPDDATGPYRMPESYCLERGTWVPNDITPLLWSQANLLLALQWAEKTASR